jgi:hypothetical protein
LNGAKYGDDGTAPAEIENPLPGLADELGGAVHQLLQYRFDPAALGRIKTVLQELMYSRICPRAGAPDRDRF